MELFQYQAVIKRAVELGQSDIIDQIAATMMACAQAKQVLCAKGYGNAALSIDALARMVPENQNRS